MQGERLRQALRDPRAFVDDEATARAEYVLCRHVLDRIDEAARTCDSPVLAVKGAALAHTVYPKPWLREMGDIDLLVHPADRASIVGALEPLGFERVQPPTGRRVSSARLGDALLRYSHGAGAFVVDLHAQLDKLVARPISYDTIRERSVAVDSLRVLRAPCLEDHALLVALHASSSDVEHPTAMIDLELLLRRGLDQGGLARRAIEWRLGSALFACLVRLRALGSTQVSDRLLAAVRPGRARLFLLERGGYLSLSAGTAEPSRRRDASLSVRTGARWVIHQTPLRDDLLQWTVGIGRYAALRVADAVVSRVAR